MFFGEIECWNYWILIKSLSICNILFNLWHILSIRKYLYSSKYQLNKPDYNILNIYTYANNINLKWVKVDYLIDCFQLLLFLSNCFLFTGIQIKINLLIQLYNYYSIHIPHFAGVYNPAYSLLLLFIHIILFLFIPDINNKQYHEMVDYYPIILIKIKMFHLYLTTFLVKLFSNEWLDGSVMRYILASDWSTSTGYCIPHILSKIICYLTLFSESIGAMMMYIDKTRYYATIYMMLFHTGISLFMWPVFLFSLVTLTFLSVFLRYHDFYSIPNTCVNYITTTNADDTTTSSNILFIFVRLIVMYLYCIISLPIPNTYCQETEIIDMSEDTDADTDMDTDADTNILGNTIHKLM